MIRQRVAVIALVVAVVFGLGLVFGVLLPRLAGVGSGPKIYNTATLLHEVQTLSQLVTVKYVLEKVVVLDDPKWYGSLGESRLLMVAHGIVKAGIDFSKLQPGDLKVSANRVTIKLPRAEITDAYLDEKETRVIERSTGLLRSFDKDMEQTARQNAVDDIRRAARLNGITKDADERARAQLTNLFRQLGFEKVEFESH